MECYFLTGASGFMGSFLLAELLGKTNATVYCLMRCETTEQGYDRLERALSAYRLDSASLLGRVEVIKGDLAKPALGLTKSHWQSLTNDIDRIYHNGAWVNFVYPYAALKAANVGSCEEVLKLAAEGKRKSIHYSSSLRVFPSSFNERLDLFEHSETGPTGALLTGYSQSKWVADRKMAKAQQLGWPVAIYRLGMITGDSNTGACNLTDLVCRFIKGCIQMGSVAKMDLEMDLTPVDYAAQALVAISNDRSNDGKIFHIVNPVATPWALISEWLRSTQYLLADVAYEQWRNQLIETVRRSPQNALAPLVDLFRENGSSQFIPRYDCSNSTDALRGKDITCPGIDERLLNVYLAYLIDAEFVAPLLESGVSNRYEPGLEAVVST